MTQAILILIKTGILLSGYSGKDRKRQRRYSLSVAAFLPSPLLPINTSIFQTDGLWSNIISFFTHMRTRYIYRAENTYSMETSRIHGSLKNYTSLGSSMGDYVWKKCLISRWLGIQNSCEVSLSALK